MREEGYPSETNVAVTIDQGSCRDEMNFAEFPLAALDDRISGHQKTLVFTDSIFDRGRNAPVTRKLTISASDEYGLPTTLDDEVILGLIQLTNQQRFSERKVFFTRRSLIKLLGWRDEGKSYDRIEESLKRWLGVTLYYEKAWWSKAEQCWVDENFHILDQVTLLDVERRNRRLKTSPDDPNAGASSFVWNDVVFGSFRAGYIKQLDLGFYRELGSSIAKRMYRFLDKRFHHGPRLEFDLRVFACEHVGLSRNYHNGEIKRRLAPAIAELEAKGFLAPMEPSERFVRKVRGLWAVAFVKAGQAPSRIRPEPSPEPTLTDVLTARGISLGKARLLLATYQEERVKDKIAMLDRLVETKDKRVSKNPAGFLVRAIEEDYRGPMPSPRRSAAPPARIRVRAQSASDETALDKYLQSLVAAERAAFEDSAVRAAEGFLRKQYEEGKAEGGSLFQAVRRTILTRHFETRRSQGTPTA